MSNMEEKVVARALGGRSVDAASAKAMVRYRKLEDHLKAKGDKDGLSLLSDFCDAMGI